MNCILARRLIERGVRFVQLYHCWDHPAGTPRASTHLDEVCMDVDRAPPLVMDLKQRGLLEIPW